MVIYNSCILRWSIFYFADILNIRVGNSFSGGLIDFLLFGVLQGNDKTNWLKLTFRNCLGNCLFLRIYFLH